MRNFSLNGNALQDRLPTKLFFDADQPDHRKPVMSDV
jgi:hypothetical protein